MSDPKIRNMDEFASVSGISRPTLSKFFNDPDSVRKSTRERIEEALEKFDYRPNLYAMNQNRRLTKTIGIVVPNLTDPFFAKIARHIEDHVIAAGYRPVLLGSNGTPAQELENLNNLRLLKPAGTLLAPLGRVSETPQIREFCNEVPTVLFDANLENTGEAFIGSDNQQSVTTIVEYLCRTGDAPAFFEMKTPTNPNAVKRRNAYISSMERLGHRPELIQVDGDGWDFEEIGFREGTRLLSGQRSATNTILCSNDRLAIGLLSAAYQLGLRVGLGDGCALRVAGHDDHPFSRYTCPTLTTVSQDYTAIARTSAETLVARIEGNPLADSRRDILFDGQLVMRGSA
ncbi:LacI family DNA-binding transcriptional regulator [Phaeobacter sp. HS012]|uniref:LacI family DNA-binding transcriptional regulator n=1 Tax=Phaeobacter TaxID=302485 RepID=UPI000C9C757C|nr:MULTISPECIES: LacI family DNA-binding transcriptional regulator [Phaeobacter]AUQ54003.1 putative transcriptional regulator, lacI family [Phaeobacter inhibens]AUQ78019.1 putative transcriptional regulator, lacI family [Phaeobacter inhibens]AUR15178.1 putative transcriptional regulator, lacI family [Phaeobacter inhibens]MBQ4806665.1 LacI family DNA-binding transcriptional regulator [Phaeobacter sp. HS012]MBQ4881515.1 LacI family DNA-binding transcriptional regulator [Phaeobacter sp. HS011]